ncbi:hypothetical protein [Paenibacillus selenitireducens]|uniref:hypothetical protein n=1 Tax=Paenibacillus selenitireducens TaxID=1324314 RepID=UPI001301BB6D|nr:hypothetical protein [Paenibacillus selenitireducens]
MRTSKKEANMRRADYRMLGYDLHESMRMGVSRSGNEFAAEMMSPTKRNMDRV